MKIPLLLLPCLCFPAWAEDVMGLCADRAAVERVYYQHRLGEKPPFERSLPPSLIQRLVQAERHKEAVLKKVYGVEVTPAQVEAEVQRIDRTTRAPNILAELKAALGNHAARFARTVARPIVVERLLRERFENDDPLHAAQRQAAEKMRLRLLAARTGDDSPRREPAAGKAEIRNPKSEESAKSEVTVSNLVTLLKGGGVGEFSEVVWQFGPRPAGTNAPDADLLEAQRRFGPNAQVLGSARREEKDGRLYFDALPPALQRVLRTQLHRAGDLSAVIEMPSGFLLYVCKEKTAATLSVITLSLSKRSFEEWFAEQNGGMK